MLVSQQSIEENKRREFLWTLFECELESIEPEKRPPIYTIEGGRFTAIPRPKEIGEPPRFGRECRALREFRDGPALLYRQAGLRVDFMRGDDIRKTIDHSWLPQPVKSSFLAWHRKWHLEAPWLMEYFMGLMVHWGEFPNSAEELRLGPTMYFPLPAFDEPRHTFTFPCEFKWEPFKESRAKAERRLVREFKERCRSFGKELDDYLNRIQKETDSRSLTNSPKWSFKRFRMLVRFHVQEWTKEEVCLHFEYKDERRVAALLSEGRQLLGLKPWRKPGRPRR